MLEPKTHFEQVPLQVVRKIVEEQFQRETTAEQDREIKKRTLEEDLWGAQEQSMAGPRRFSPVELLEQP
jgi:hypothetical protein